jgi:hypothetical protein
MRGASPETLELAESGLKQIGSVVKALNARDGVEGPA